MTRAMRVQRQPSCGTVPVRVVASRQRSHAAVALIRQLGEASGGFSHVALEEAVEVVHDEGTDHLVEETAGALQPV